MYLRNSWYVVAWSRDLASPQAIMVMDEPLVVFRKASGGVAVLADRCAHRQLPLSMGTVDGDAIRCGYHGMKFDADGSCVAIPSQAMIPPRARVRAYPAHEAHGWVWAWMGEADRADPASIPDFSMMTDPAFAASGKTNHVRASYELVTDNLMDLSHVGFVHTTTIGNAAFGEKGRLTVQRTATGVRALRLVPEVPPPPLYVSSGRLPAGKSIDRWQDIEFIAPCFVRIHTGGAEAGTGVLDGEYAHGLNLWVLNAMTPETATSTNYFWGSVRAHAIGDTAADALFFDGVSEAFDEDRVVLEAQQKAMGANLDDWSLALKADAASIEARRVLDRAIADENRPATRAVGAA